jgi:hypothetical protein
MKEKTANQRPGPILSALLGLGAFLISSLVAAWVIWKIDNYILATIIAGGLGCLLLGSTLRTGPDIKKFIITGLAAMPIAMLLTFLIAGLFELILPAAASYLDKTWFSDIMAVCLMGMFFGGICGAVLYGRRKIGLFILVCGIVCIPFGYLVAAMNAQYINQYWLTRRFAMLGFADLNFLAIMSSLGLGVGLSIGISNRLSGNVG